MTGRNLDVGLEAESRKPKFGHNGELKENARDIKMDELRLTEVSIESHENDINAGKDD